jgi:hypothetical protein
MFSYNARILLLMSLLTVLLVALGWQRPTARDSDTEDVAAPEPLHPEQARDALVALLTKEGIEQEAMQKCADGDKVIPVLLTQEELEKVRRQPIHENQGHYYIGSWACDLKGLRFNSAGVMVGGCLVALEGRFKGSGKGEYKAVLLGCSYGYVGRMPD